MSNFNIPIDLFYSQLKKILSTILLPRSEEQEPLIIFYNNINEINTIVTDPRFSSKSPIILLKYSPEVNQHPQPVIFFPNSDTTNKPEFFLPWTPLRENPALLNQFVEELSGASGFLSSITFLSECHVPTQWSDSLVLPGEIITEAHWSLYQIIYCYLYKELVNSSKILSVYDNDPLDEAFKNFNNYLKSHSHTKLQNKSSQSLSSFFAPVTKPFTRYLEQLDLTENSSPLKAYVECLELHLSDPCLANFCLIPFKPRLSEVEDNLWNEITQHYLRELISKQLNDFAILSTYDFKMVTPEIGDIAFIAHFSASFNDFFKIGENESTFYSLFFSLFIMEDDIQKVLSLLSQVCQSDLEKAWPVNIIRPADLISWYDNEEGNEDEGDDQVNKVVFQEINQVKLNELLRRLIFSIPTKMLELPFAFFRVLFAEELNLSNLINVARSISPSHPVISLIMEVDEISPSINIFDQEQHSLMM